MHQFFVEQEQVCHDRIEITGNDVNHIKNVLRMKSGQQIRINAAQPVDYICEIREITAQSVVAEILERKPALRELPARIFLYQGLPKADKMEWIIQKAVELGVHQIIPVAARRCVVKLDAKKADKKLARWNLIAESAAKQSGRTYVPEVKPVISFSEALADSEQMNYRLLAYENEHGITKTRSVISEMTPDGDIAVFIGPEGGIDPQEAEAAREAGMTFISLGNRILRTETAGLALLSVLMFQIETDVSED